MSSIPRSPEEVKELAEAIEAARTSAEALTAEQAAMVERGLELEASMERNRTAYSELLRQESRRLEAMKKTTGSTATEINALEDKIAKLREARALLKQMHDEEKLQLKEAEEAKFKARKKELERTKKYVKTSSKTVKSAMDKDTKDLIGTIQGAAGKAVDTISSLVTNVSPMLQVLSAFFPKLTIRNLYENMASELKGMEGEIKGVVKRTGIYTKELDDNIAAAMDPDGAIKDLRVNFAGLREPMRELGLVSKETAPAQEALLNNFSKFRPTFVEANRALSIVTVNMVAGLKKLGANEVTTAKLLDQFNKALGETPEQALDTTMQITSMAKSLGVNLGQAFKDLTGLMPTLAQFGSRVVEVFGKMKAAALATGIEVNKLTQFSMKMDKWKGAAEAVQRFNAVLGETAVDVAEVWRADPNKRIDIFVNAFKRARGSIHTENRRFIQELSEALPAGGDTEFTRRLFGSQKELGLIKKKLDLTSMSNEELEKMVLTSKTSIEMLNRAISRQGMGFKRIIDKTRGFAVKAGNQITASFKTIHKNGKSALESSLGIVAAFRSAIGLAGNLGIALAPVATKMKAALGGSFLLGGGLDASGGLTEAELEKLKPAERKRLGDLIKKARRKAAAAKPKAPKKPPTPKKPVTPSTPITCPTGFRKNADGTCSPVTSGLPGSTPGDEGKVEKTAIINMYAKIDTKDIKADVLRVIGSEFRIERGGAAVFSAA